MNFAVRVVGLGTTFFLVGVIASAVADAIHHRSSVNWDRAVSTGLVVAVLGTVIGILGFWFAARARSGTKA